MRFNGADYEPDRDNPRLVPQYWRIFMLMRDGRWRTLRQIADEVMAPESSVSAQLRHMRKKRFGEHTVERVHCGDGLYQYRLVENESADVSA